MTTSQNATINSGLADYVRSAIEAIARIPLPDVAAVVALLREAAANGRNVYTMGNGGSAMTAAHLAGDLNKGTSPGRKNRFRAICLSDNLATFSAYANDVGYESVFVDPLRNFLRAGEVVIGISGSGNSPNVVKAVEWAATQGAHTVALVGYDGGALKRVAGHTIHIPVNDMQIVEDMHLLLCHMMMRALMTD